MKLIVPHTLKKTEYLLYEKIFSLEVLKEAARKALGGIGETIKNTRKLPSTVLKKVPLTSPNGAGRVLFLLKIDSQYAIFLMLRPKNDKQIGANMSVKNAKFRKILEKNLDMLLGDLTKKKFEEYLL